MNTNQKKLDELRKLIAAGINQANRGRTLPFTEKTMQEIKRRGRERRREREDKSTK